MIKVYKYMDDPVYASGVFMYTVSDNLIRLLL